MEGVLVSEVHSRKIVHDIFQRFWNRYGAEGRGANIERILEEQVFIWDVITLKVPRIIEQLDCEVICLVQGKVACDEDNDVSGPGVILLVLAPPITVRRRLTYDGVSWRQTRKVWVPYTPRIPPNRHGCVLGLAWLCTPQIYDSTGTFYSNCATCMCVRY